MAKHTFKILRCSHLPAHTIEFVSGFIFSKANIRRQKAKEIIEEKRISVENLTGYNDIICDFALCTFNLLDRVVNFCWLFNVVYV